MIYACAQKKRVNDAIWYIYYQLIPLKHNFRVIKEGARPALIWVVCLQQPLLRLIIRYIAGGCMEAFSLSLRERETIITVAPPAGFGLR